MGKHICFILFISNCWCYIFTELAQIDCFIFKNVHKTVIVSEGFYTKSFKSSSSLWKGELAFVWFIEIYFKLVSNIGINLCNVYISIKNRHIFMSKHFCMLLRFLMLLHIFLTIYIFMLLPIFILFILINVYSLTKKEWPTQVEIINRPCVASAVLQTPLSLII